VEDNSKIVFHCSAGIGRTGTMLAIYNIIESLKILLENPSDDNAPRISIFGVVRRLREQRYCMVQTSSQYEFIYQYILDYLITNGIIENKFPINTFGEQDDQ
jgi:receptor-type tyrosine-protein phosphatase gamma